MAKFKVKIKRRAAAKTPEAVSNLICVSDLHVGCQMGLCPPEGYQMDDGGRYMPSKLQSVVWGWWEQFWGEWVPEVTHGEPFAVCVNGDAIDGSHHNGTTQWSHNLKDQVKAAATILKPVVELCEGRYYHIRGTEAHVGQSGCEEERLAEILKAIPTQTHPHQRRARHHAQGRGDPEAQGLLPHHSPVHAPPWRPRAHSTLGGRYEALRGRGRLGRGGWGRRRRGRGRTLPSTQVVLGLA